MADPRSLLAAENGLHTNVHGGYYQNGKESTKETKFKVALAYEEAKLEASILRRSNVGSDSG